jgi:hypothetical protein
MKDLVIESTQSTLKINFNSKTGVCLMQGSSYPENSVKFYNPLSDWIKEYIAAGNTTITLNLKIIYINTSSTKCLLDILDLIESFHSKGNQALINWYFPEDEDDIKETGEELTEDLSIPVKFISE